MVLNARLYVKLMAQVKSLKLIVRKKKEMKKKNKQIQSNVKVKMKISLNFRRNNFKYLN